MRSSRLAPKPRSKGNRCQCGCGVPIPLVGKSGVPQRFVHGHNGRGRPEQRVDYDGPGGCWLWLGGTNENGYGRLSADGQMHAAHRWFYERAVGPIPYGLQLDHLCNRAGCVNPAHLEPVSAAENVQRSSKAKLELADVEEIRNVKRRLLAVAPLKRDGSQRVRVPGGLAVRIELATQYGVTPDQIKHIWAGRSWAS